MCSHSLYEASSQIWDERGDDVGQVLIFLIGCAFGMGVGIHLTLVWAVQTAGARQRRSGRDERLDFLLRDGFWTQVWTENGPQR